MKAADHLTRNLGLWITNDEGCYQRYSEQAQRLYQDELDSEEEPTVAKRLATLALADMIEEDFSQSVDDIENISGWALDILTTALAHVDWKDLAEYYTADMVD